MLIDLCDELHNVRSAAAESKQNLESISQDLFGRGMCPRYK